MFPFTREEVLSHLHQLGHRNVSQLTLDQFMKDLERLIRYDQKKEGKRHAERSSSETSDLRGTKTRRESKVVHTEHVTRHDTSKIKFSPESNSLSLSSSSECYASTTTTSTSDNTTRHQRFTRRSEVHVQVNVEPEDIGASSRAPETTEEDEDENPVDTSTRLKQILPPRPMFPRKPTTAFIRPPPTKPVPKTDPVQTYQFYKDLWSKQNFPGDASKNKLRWTVREWMMGHRE